MDKEGRHSSALFVQSVPHTLAGARWEDEEEAYVAHLLSICDRFAPGTSALVADTFTLTPPKARREQAVPVLSEPQHSAAESPRPHSPPPKSPPPPPSCKRSSTQIEKHFGITGGHIHHVDNSLSFDERFPARTPLQARGVKGAHTPLPARRARPCLRARPGLLLAPHL